VQTLFPRCHRLAARPPRPPPTLRKVGGAPAHPVRTSCEQARGQWSSTSTAIPRGMANLVTRPGRPKCNFGPRACAPCSRLVSLESTRMMPCRRRMKTKHCSLILFRIQPALMPSGSAGEARHRAACPARCFRLTRTMPRSAVGANQSSRNRAPSTIATTGRRGSKLTQEQHGNW
jgi:hypothetical protein